MSILKAHGDDGRDVAHFLERGHGVMSRITFRFPHRRIPCPTPDPKSARGRGKVLPPAAARDSGELTEVRPGPVTPAHLFVVDELAIEDGTVLPDGVGAVLAAVSL